MTITIDELKDRTFAKLTEIKEVTEGMGPEVRKIEITRADSDARVTRKVEALKKRGDNIECACKEIDSALAKILQRQIDRVAE